MFRHFDPELRILSDLNPALAVPDPYYGTLLDFQNVLTMIEKAADGFVDRVIESRKGNF
jgi:protein-tyrosine-phosphatase